MTSIGVSEGLRQDFREDLETRWVPDVIADADFESQVARGVNSGLQPGDLRYVDVPKASGGVRSVPFLSGAGMGALHEAVSELRDVADDRLGSSVCGYRRGSDAAYLYRTEYERFTAFNRGISQAHAYVVCADVANFFESVNIQSISRAMSDEWGRGWEQIECLLAHMHRLGARGLPAGYGDSRLVGNLILKRADDCIAWEFTRWVDDYRIFVDSPAEATSAIRALEDALAALGLSLNATKTQVFESGEFLSVRMGKPLDSVYHPESEGEASLRAGLRSVFLEGAANRNRRLIRFALPRLAEQKDPIAIDFCLTSLKEGSIEAPRCVAYLGEFLDAPALSKALEEIVVTCPSDWIFMRLSPLLCRLPLSRRTLDSVTSLARSTSSDLVWASALRVLSVATRDDLCSLVIHDGVRDDRAYMAACIDLASEAQAVRFSDTDCGLIPYPLPRLESSL